MIKLGYYSTLEVVKTLSFGAYLDAGPFGEVLLPKRYVPRGLEAGDALEVFLYCDSDDRVIATTERPFAAVGEFAGLVAKDVAANGAYVDWGLMKDLLVPFREQSEKMEVGKVYVVKVLFDETTDRIYGTSKISKYLLDTNDGELKEGDLAPTAPRPRAESPAPLRNPSRRRAGPAARAPSRVRQDARFPDATG